MKRTREHNEPKAKERLGGWRKGVRQGTEDKLISQFTYCLLASLRDPLGAVA
jgi:hypothetical protein